MKTRSVDAEHAGAAAPQPGTLVAIDWTHMIDPRLIGEVLIVVVIGALVASIATTPWYIDFGAVIAMWGFKAWMSY